MTPLTCSVEEAARIIGISRGAAYELARAGRLPHLRVGRRYYIYRERLAAFLDREAERNAANGSLEEIDTVGQT